MTASSVTGVGVGAAEMTRGPGNDRGLFYSVVDPHVVWHGTAALDDGSATIYLPSTIRVPPEHLAVFVTGKMSYVIEKLVDVDGNMEGFVISGYGDQFDYIVIDANNDCFCEDLGEENN
jgi:hypothetical protein